MKGSIRKGKWLESKYEHFYQNLPIAGWSKASLGKIFDHFFHKSEIKSHNMLKTRFYVPLLTLEGQNVLILPIVIDDTDKYLLMVLVLIEFVFTPENDT